MATGDPSTMLTAVMTLGGQVLSGPMGVPLQSN